MASPKQTQTLIEYFLAHPVIQSGGLDDVGTAATDSASAITMEKIQGTREELYWNKVPAKVRSQAVQKAVRLMNPESEKDYGDGDAYDDYSDEGDRSRKRKRRKK